MLIRFRVLTVVPLLLALLILPASGCGGDDESSESSGSDATPPADGSIAPDSPPGDSSNPSTSPEQSAPEGRRLAAATFDDGLDGWTVTRGSAEWIADGAGGGHLKALVNQDRRTAYYVAPDAWHRNWIAAGAILRFDLRSTGGRYFTSRYGMKGDVVLANGAMTARFDFVERPPGTWTTFRIDPLTADWTLDGGAQTIRDVLANVTALHIRAEYGVGTDESRLDNVMLVESDGSAPSLDFLAAPGDDVPDTGPSDPGFFADADADDAGTEVVGRVWTSDFADGDGGWTVRDGTLERLATDGNGFLRASSPADGRLPYFIAPNDYRGPWSTANTIRFRIRAAGSGSHTAAAAGDVILTSGSVVASHTLDRKVGPEWTTISIPLVPTEWQVEGPGSLADLLAKVDGFRIRARFAGGTVDLDDVQVVDLRPVRRQPEEPTPDDGPVEIVVTAEEFRDGDGGWTVPVGTRTWVEQLEGGGYLQAGEGGRGTNYFVAPDGFHGPWASVDLIRVTLRSAGGRYFDTGHGSSGDLVITGAGGSASYVFDHRPAEEWETFEVRLADPAWEVSEGTTLDEILRNVTGFQIRAEYGVGEDTGSLSAVELVDLQ
jgi:hypothetical protein